MKDDFYIDIEPEEFEAFKKELHSKNKTGAYALVDLQKFSYSTAKTLLKSGLNAEGDPLTEEEKGYLKRIIKDIEGNFKALKVEYGFTEEV